MRRRTEIILIAALLMGVAAIFATKRGARPDAGSRGGGACCPLMQGLNLLPANSGATAESTNVQPCLTAGEAITNHQR